MIIPIKHMRGAYEAMNQALVDEFKRQGANHADRLAVHQPYFEQTYNVQIIVENGVWSAIKFPSEQAATLALLKWSS